LPGSINPTVTRRPGPIYFKILRAPKVGLWLLLSMFLKKENMFEMQG
jgi:hypothetical protein